MSRVVLEEEIGPVAEAADPGPNTGTLTEEPTETKAAPTELPAKLDPPGRFATPAEEVNYLIGAARAADIPEVLINGTHRGDCNEQKATQADALRDILKVYGIE